MKQRSLLPAAWLILLTLLSACGVSKETVDALERDKKRMEDSLTTAIKSLQAENEALRRDTATLHTQLAEAKQREKKLQEEAQRNLADLEKRATALEKQLALRDAKLSRLQEALRAALLSFKDSGLDVYVKGDNVYVSLSNKLLFPLGSTAIDEKGKKALDKLAAVLNENPDINIQVEGHTDTTPITKLENVKDNWDLSVLRATEVVRYLTQEGKVNPKRIVAAGRGEYYPVDARNTPEAKAKNRRIEIVLTPDLSELIQLAKASDGAAITKGKAAKAAKGSKKAKAKGKKKGK
ncbi:MAG: OmpA family protein [Chloroherpetonaceae bacterium]|nr:OmpA family protein [Chloroherpetonaceae bacterium]MCS7210215.1 OmpA family protein [Chloroherpetonaceae bacterium]MDW8018486.1 OmpA family protein [Chloroherpetonaceae bacterium]MDW8466376.1 OmpA family protein [Chloroherpetonaceae bacterium]